MNVERNSITKKLVEQVVLEIKGKLKHSNPHLNSIKIDVEKDSYFYRAKIEMRENAFHFISEKKHALWKKALFSAYKTVLKKMRQQQKKINNKKRPRLSFHFHDELNIA